MEFCPRCGAVLIQKRSKYGCPRCTYYSKDKIKISTSEKIDEKHEVAIVSEKGSSIHPIVEVKCKECKNDKAYFWSLQTRASDEAETKFFKCTKCEHTWRDYR